MASEFLIDLNDHENRRDVAIGRTPDGRIGSEVAAIIPPEGPRQMFWMLDTIMYALPEGMDPDKNHQPHEHRFGYETFSLTAENFGCTSTG